MIIAHKKNTAFELVIPMVDSASPASFKTGLTVADTAYYKDGAGAWTSLAITDTFTEIGATGLYEISLTISEMNHDWVVIKASVAGAADTFVTFEMFTHDIDDVVDANDQVDVGSWLGTAAATPTVAGVPEVDLTHIGGVSQSATDLKDFADTGYDPVTHKVQGVVLADTTTANSDMRGTDSAALASVCTEARLAELDAANLPSDVDDVKAVTDNLPDSGALSTMDGKLDTIAAYIDTEIAEIVGYLDTEIAAIKAKTDGLNFTSTNVNAHIKVTDDIDLTPTQKTSVETGVQNRIEANDLDHVTKVSHGATKPTDGSLFDQIMNANVNQDFDSASDSLEAISLSIEPSGTPSLED